MKNYLKIISGSSNPELVREICDYLDCQQSKVEIERYANDNIKVRVLENVREDDVFVVQTSCPPVNDNFIELLLMIDALKYASARRVTAVLPYYPYVRSDKKDEPRISISARLVADLLETAGADRILTMTLHSPQIVAFARIPVDQLWATNLLCNHMRQKDLNNAVVVSPDVGSADEASHYARRLELPLAIMDKRRQGDDEKAEVLNVIGDIEGKDALLFDDEVLTGGSMMEAVRLLKKRGARRIMAGCTHGVFSGEAVERIEASELEAFLKTNTIPPTDSQKQSSKIEVISVARLFAEAIKAIHHGESVSRLLD